MIQQVHLRCLNNNSKFYPGWNWLLKLLLVYHNHVTSSSSSRRLSAKKLQASCIIFTLCGYFVCLGKWYLCQKPTFTIFKATFQVKIKYISTTITKVFIYSMNESKSHFTTDWLNLSEIEYLIKKLHSIMIIFLSPYVLLMFIFLVIISPRTTDTHRSSVWFSSLWPYYYWSRFYSQA